MPEGRQSPPPEAQTGAQQQSIPGTGESVNKDTNNQAESKDQREALSSNPTGPLDAHAKEVVSKTMDPSEGSK
ncbi:hypothetical protein HYALB_00008565 [Hymenoscyphus albidus]|uniref:Uncharacterized protein n=1 Tax=Hymenoscyphus albidus TaxID=595503 RepID=A0A9N9LM46_9HELO|nr:hypothetical protein HYALB_00008565 [Hymenoscyphus albidus]